MVDLDDTDDASDAADAADVGRTGTGTAVVLETGGSLDCGATAALGTAA